MYREEADAVPEQRQLHAVQCEFDVAVGCARRPCRTTVLGVDRAFALELRHAHVREGHGLRELVDDDALLTDMYGRQLTSSGYTVSTARTGEEAVELARAETPDLIFLDLGLPGISGLEVLQRLKEQGSTARIPVVVLSNYSEPETIAKSLSMGASEYLVKAHTTPAHLSDTTRRWTNGHQPG